MPPSTSRAAALLVLSVLAASARGAGGAVTWPGTVGSGAPGFQGGYYSSDTQQSGSAWTDATCTAQCTATANCVAVIVQSSMNTAAATGTCWTVTTAQLTSAATVVPNSGYTTYIGPTTTTACASSPCTALAKARACRHGAAKAQNHQPRAGGRPPVTAGPPPHCLTVRPRLCRRRRRTLAPPTAW